MTQPTNNNTHQTGQAVTALLATGGTGHNWACRTHADIIIMVDSVDELASVPDQDNVIKIHMGDHETLGTLIERMQGDSLAEELAILYRNRPNILLSKGMAQDPRIGALAVRDLLRSGKLEALARLVMNKLMVAANGALSNIELIEINSNAGGMGAGGGPEMGRYIANFIETASRATLKHSMYRFGALTFLTVADRVAGNARYTTELNLADLPAQRTTRSIQNVELMELPLRDRNGREVGGNKDLRDLLTGILMQARRSPEVASAVDSREVNDRIGEFSEFSRVAACWSEIQDTREIVREVAAHYQREFGKRIAAWSEAVVDDERDLEVSPGELGAPTVDAVLAELKSHPQSDGPLLLQLFAEVQTRPTGTVTYTADGSTTSLDTIIRQFTRGEVSEAEIIALVTTLRRKRAALEAEVAEARTRLDDNRKSLRSQLTEIRKQSQTGWAKFRTRVESGRTRVQRSVQTMRSLEPRVRALTESYGQVAHGLASVDLLHAAIGALERAAGSRFEAVLASLARLAGAGVPSTGRLRYKSLGAVTGDLEAAVAKGDEFVARVLMGCVESVTLAGVAALLGAIPEPSAIVTALESRFPWVAPLWGGASNLAGPRRRVVVFPPMRDDDFEAIRREAQVRGYVPELRRAGSVMAGCAAVALDFYTVENREDVLPAFYASQPVLDGTRTEAPAQRATAAVN